MKRIITISRQFGAGGSQIGTAVARRLGWYYMDKDMIIRSAVESSNLTPRDFRIYDEKVPFNFGFGQSLFDFYNKPLDVRLFEAQRGAIIKAAEAGNCVIVGRNANVILREYDYTLHVFVAASEFFKLNNMRQKMPGVSDEKILEHMRDVDRTRKKYCSYYTHTEFGNAEHYDLCIKSSSLGIEACVDMICRIAEAQ